MKNDVIMVDDGHVNKGIDIYDALSDNCSLICIGGGPGTGKTEVASVLDRLLNNKGRWTQTLNMDQFYFIPPDKREAHRRATGLIGPEEICWYKLTSVMKLLPHYKVWIIEGLYALSINKGFRVHLNGTQESTYDFRKDRGKEDPDCEWRQHVLNEEYNITEQLKTKADLIV